MKLTPSVMTMVVCILFPVMGDAGQFFIQDVWYVKTEGTDRTHVRVGSRAQFQGVVEPGDNNWTIEAHLFVGEVPYYGSPKSGDTISPNMEITCPDTIGGFHEFDNCPVVNYHGKGLVAIYNNWSPKIDTKVAEAFDTICQQACGGSTIIGRRRIAAATCVDGPEGGNESPPGDGTECSNNCWESPILIDFDGGSIALTDLQDGVWFDIEPGGAIERMAWTVPQSGDAFLALDRNGNGLIENGAELFGNNTSQPSSGDPNGFRALQIFDLAAEGGDSDGWLTERDAVFSELRLWRDADHDGHSDVDELLPLSAAGVEAIELSYVDSRHRDRHGNQFRYTSMVRLRRSTRQAVDVFLLSQ